MEISLWTKIGKVIEVGAIHNDYKRVKVDFPLDKPVMRVVKQKVKGHGVLEFLVRYENIPHFCFFCGCIGHAQRECSEEGAEMGDVRFGQNLRCSPQKKVLVRRGPKRATVPTAKRGLNFSGDQKRKVMSEGYSSNASPRGGDHSFYSGRDDWEMGQHSKEDVSCNSEVPIEVQADLVESVANMSVDAKLETGANSHS
jgi:hypothetical protein